MFRLPVARAAAAALIVLLAAAPAPAAGDDVAAVGRYAPPLEASDLSGAPVSIRWAEEAPGATVILFFDAQSPDSLLELSFLAALQKRARDFGIAVYAIDAVGRQPAEVARALERYLAIYGEPEFPILPDPGFRAPRLYGVRRAPATFVAESHGVVLNRFEGYGNQTAVAITRRVEQLLGREKGYFSTALRDTGITVEEERTAERRIEAELATAEPAASAPVRSLGPGDRAAAFEFRDLAGRLERWDWPGGGGVRVILFWGGMALPSIEALTRVDALARRGSDVGLEVIAIEGSGMEAPEVAAAMERYRRYNPAPAFPVVPDPDGVIGTLFLRGDVLPLAFLVALDGTIIHRTEGFGAAEATELEGKVERAFTLAGRPFPRKRDALEEVAPAAAPLLEEAPSLRQKRQVEERYRSNIMQADAYFLAWEYERALPYYLEALQEQPRDRHALARTAQIYDRRGDEERALDYWERVLAVRPDDRQAQARVRELRQVR